MASEKKKRIFFLDFIRALAVIVILLTHYNALFLYMNPQPLDKVVLTYRVCNLYIGDFGVSLFFIISGAALMYTYEKNLDLWKFYKKRLLAIYPMFWISYILAALVMVGMGKWNTTVPLKNYVLSFLGFDSYYAGVTVTQCLVGEWFLGCIILVYLLFPLLRKGCNDHPAVFSVALLVLYIVNIYIVPSQLGTSINVLVRLPEVFFGMLFMKYIKKSTWWMALPSLVILIANTYFAPSWNASLQTTYVGIAAFLVLVFIGNFLDHKPFQVVCSFLSKYCYAIFLIHHFIIYRICERIDFYSISTKKSYAIFCLCAAVILICSVGVFYLEKLVMKPYYHWAQVRNEKKEAQPS